MILIGDSGTGKTTLINVFESGLFEPDKVVVTINADCRLLTVPIKGKARRICFWSVSGNRNYENYNRVSWYKNKEIAFVVYDIGNR